MMSGLPKNDSSQAMQNLFSAYGDDEADGDESMKMDAAFTDDEELSDHSGTPRKPQPTAQTLPGKTASEKSDPDQEEESRSIYSEAKLSRKITGTRLVSYAPDDQEGEGDDEEEGESAKEEDMFSQFRPQPGVITYNGTAMTSEELNSSLVRSIRHSLSEDDVQIPPEPPGNCSIRLQAKITKLYEKFLHTGKDMNATIERRKDIRNPSIYEKLIEFCNIDEKGTNYPPELYNPTIWSEDSTFEVLAQIQRAEMDKREKERREKKDKALTVERLHGTKKPFTIPSNPSTPTVDQKRKTKWDSAASADSSTSAAGAGTNFKTKSFP